MDHYDNYFTLKNKLIEAMSFHVNGDDGSAFFRIGMATGKLVELVKQMEKEFSENSENKDKKNG